MSACCAAGRCGSLPELLTYVGKDSNRLNEVEAGLGHDPDEIYTQYADPTRDPWRVPVVPVLKQIPAKRLGEETELAASTVKAARNGHTVSRDRNREALVRIATEYAREQLRKRGVEPPAEKYKRRSRNPKVTGSRRPRVLVD